MKLKDGFHASSYDIGGLILDMPTKNPKTYKRSKFKVDDVVRREAEGFVYPFRRYAKKILSNSAIVCIGNTMRCDRSIAKHRHYLAIAESADVEVVKGR